MGRFSFRAGINAENPDFTIVRSNSGRDQVRRLAIDGKGNVTEDVFERGGEPDVDVESVAPVAKARKR